MMSRGGRLSVFPLFDRRKVREQVQRIWSLFTTTWSWKCPFINGSSSIGWFQIFTWEWASPLKFPGLTYDPIFVAVATNEPSIRWVYKMISWKFVWSTFWVVHGYSKFSTKWSGVFARPTWRTKRSNTTSSLNLRVHFVDFSKFQIKYQGIIQSYTGVSKTIL